MSYTCDDENLVCAGPGLCPRCTREYDDGVRDDPPPPSADELARKQRVVDAIGTFMSKPAKPVITRRWRRKGFR